MARERRLDQFPDEFYDAWSLAKKGLLRLEFPTQSKAIGLRHRLYAFRTMLRKDSGLTDFDRIELIVEAENDKWILQTGKAEWKSQLAELMKTLPSNGG